MCIGCFRTLEELGRWTSMSRDEHLAVKKALEAREDAYRATKLG